MAQDQDLVSQCQFNLSKRDLSCYLHQADVNDKNWTDAMGWVRKVGLTRY